MQPAYSVNINPGKNVFPKANFAAANKCPPRIGNQPGLKKNFPKGGPHQGFPPHPGFPPHAGVQPHPGFPPHPGFNPNH